jgi:hypothetical protein
MWRLDGIWRPNLAWRPNFFWRPNLSRRRIGRRFAGWSLILFNVGFSISLFTAPSLALAQMLVVNTDEWLPNTCLQLGISTSS